MQQRVTVSLLWAPVTILAPLGKTKKESSPTDSPEGLILPTSSDTQKDITGGSDGRRADMCRATEDPVKHTIDYTPPRKT